MHRLFKLYAKSLLAMAFATVIGVQLYWWPERLSNELEEWRGLPTAMGEVLMAVFIILAAASAISTKRRSPAENQ